MKLTKTQVRFMVLSGAIVLINLMSSIMLWQRIGLTENSGMAMGIGFANLLFLVLGLPLLIMFILLDAGWRWWAVMLPSSVLFVFLLFL